LPYLKEGSIWENTFIRSGCRVFLN
jgi:hypothetical protein